MGKLKIVAAAAAASVFALAAGSASAAAYVGTIPGLSNSNQFLNMFTGGASVQGWYGANLYLVGGAADIKVEYFGAEAGARNFFSFAGGACTATHAANDGGGAGTFQNVNGGGLDAGDVVQSSCTVNAVAAGLLDFFFTTTAGIQVDNGANRDNSDLTSNFFMTFDTTPYSLDTNTNDGTPGGGQSVFIFFDDSGASNDDNHDDMVIRLSITNGRFQVPEPTALALVGLALTGLGLSRRRKAQG